jgi:hypothetical protein
MLAGMLLLGYPIDDVESHPIPPGRELSADEFTAFCYMAIGCIWRLQLRGLSRRHGLCGIIKTSGGWSR